MLKWAWKAWTKKKEKKISTLRNSNSNSNSKIQKFKNSKIQKFKILKIKNEIHFKTKQKKLKRIFSSHIALFLFHRNLWHCKYCIAFEQSNWALDRRDFEANPMNEDLRSATRMEEVHEIRFDWKFLFFVLDKHIWWNSQARLEDSLQTHATIECVRKSTNQKHF